MDKEIKKIIKCPSIESSEFLCNRNAEYLIRGTLWCGIHARRLMEQE